MAARRRTALSRGVNRARNGVKTKGEAIGADAAPPVGSISEFPEMPRLLRGQARTSKGGSPKTYDRPPSPAFASPVSPSLRSKM